VQATAAVFFLSFVMLAIEPGQAQASSPRATSPLTRLAVDLNKWLTHITHTGGQHDVEPSPPLPRPRPVIPLPSVAPKKALTPLPMNL
jgi:hypothetical protein